MKNFNFACPVCRCALNENGPTVLVCPKCLGKYPFQQGIWRMLPQERISAYSQFTREYETVRTAEGRGSGEPNYYLDLPYHDRSGRMSADWDIRAKSYDALIARMLTPLEAQVREGRKSRSLRIIDLGAGNGWLSHRLAQRGHIVAAVDILVNDLDGLGAWVHYPSKFIPLQAEFDRLPLLGGQADLVIFNASLHYSIRYEHTLEEVLRVLEPGGSVVIMDTPLYRDAASGAQMARERAAQYTRQFGFASSAVASEQYLTYQRLADLERALNLRWRFIHPRYGWRWTLRPWKALLLGRREPARFVLLVGEKANEGFP